ncbi:MAG: Ig-like domain-containing protein [Anaerolineae bacterium]
MSTRTRRLTVAALLLLPVVLILALGLSVRHDSAHAPADAISDALANARAAGSYHLAADIQQALIPRALPENLGKSDTRTTLRVDGEALVPDRARLTLRLGGDGDVSGEQPFGVGMGPSAASAGAPIKLLVVGNRAFVGHDGAWRVVENPLSAAAPVADYLSFLTAIKDVQPADDLAVSAAPAIADARRAMQHYRFTLDGPRYAEYLKEQLQTLLADDLPPGVELQAPPIYQRMTGTGELWVDGDGLPRRLLVDMTLPGVSDGSDAQVHMLVDYSQFGAAVAPIEAPQPGGPDGAWTVYAAAEPGQPDSQPAAPAVPDAQSPAAVAGSLMPKLGEWASTIWPGLLKLIGAALVIAVAGLCLWYRRRRAVYAGLVLYILVALLAAPLLQAVLMSRYATHAAAQESLPQAVADLGLGPSPTERDRVAELRADLAASGPAATTIVNDCLTLPEGVSAAGDDDHDGLTNGIERCLGTDYLNADTDGDGINDGDEVKGFVVGSKTWTTDPLQRDSNHDGMDDAMEWSPDWVKNKPATLDYDGDGIPNAWDSDNDNDGVPDDLDLSPYKKLDYRANYSFSVTKPTSNALHSNTYVYVDVQVQPETASHLRYTMSILDWPYDDQGQIQDLDKSTDDIKLIPVLELKSTVNPKLAAQYGINVENVNNQYYRLLVPLTTVESAGNISAFSARLAFLPSEVTSTLQLTEVRLGWMVQAKLDQSKCLSQSGTTCTQTTVEVTDSVVVSYYEPKLRVTGLNVVESGSTTVGLFGVPTAPEISTGTTPDEAREIFNLVSGMGPAFLFNVQPDIPAIAKRFTDPTTPVEQKWGVTTPVQLTTATYAHEDLAVATTSMTTTVKFLDQYYQHTLTPTLALAYEEVTGRTDIGGEQGVTFQDSPSTSPTTTAIGVNLTSNSLFTVRAVQIQQYHYVKGSDGKLAWKSLTMNQALGELDRRYANQTDVYIRTLWLTWYGGQVNYIMVNGQVIVGPNGETLIGTKADDAALYARFSQPSQPKLPGYVQAAYHLDALAADIGLDGAAAGWREWSASQFNQPTPTSQGMATFIAAAGAVFIQILPVLRLVGQGIKWGARAAYGAIKSALRLGDAATGVTRTAEAAASGAKGLGKMAVAVAIIVAVIALVMVWSSFHGYSDSVSHLQTDMELASAIASTIMIVFTLVLSLVLVAVASTEVGILVELIVAVLTYLFVALITGDWNPLNTFSHIVEWLADYILKVAFYAELPEDNPVKSSDLTLTLADESKGTVINNAVTFLTHLTTTIEVGPGEKHWNWAHSRGGNVDDVKQSSAFTKWSSTDSIATSTRGTCWMVGSVKYCPTTVTASFTPQSAIRNAVIHVTSIIDYSLRYQKCWKVPFARTCSADTATGSGPTTSDKDAWSDATSPIYLDVLPSTVDNLWTWSQVTNRDKDGDGVADSTEAALGASTTTWDTDGDGLSDGFERDNATSLGTNLSKKDTDGDGLTDLEEYVLGTSINVADTDGDGLKDGEEVCHVDASGSLVGGWLVTNSGGWRTCSNPLDADSDRDKLTDLQEKSLGQSPWSPNTSVTLLLSTQPQTTHDTATFTLLKPGDTMTGQFTLTNSTAATITSTMQLCLSSAAFAAPTVTSVTQTTGYTPPTATTATQGANICAAWNFATRPFVTGDFMTVGFSAKSLSTATSGETTLSLSVPYIDPANGTAKTSTQAASVRIDADNPSTTIAAPPTGTALNGTAYVVGGSATDKTSWVNSVQVSMDNWATTKAASGTDTWTWTWSPLPADGVYTLRARSTDAAGRTSADVTQSAVVDKTAPGASFTSLKDGQVLTGLTPDSVGGASVTLTGTATDRLSGAAQVAGVDVVQLSIDGRPWQAIWQNVQATAPATVDWTYTWKLNANASGQHTLSVRASDALGQTGQTQTISVIVDVVAPANIITNYTTDLKAGVPVTIQGHADDLANVPLAPRPAPLTGTRDSVISATILLEPSQIGDLAGAKVAWLGDVDGDSRADAAIGMPAYNGGAGQVVILKGRAGGWPVPPSTEALNTSDSRLIVADASAIGAHIAPAGDVNGDGLADLMVGNPTDEEVYVVFGRIGPMGADWDLEELKNSNAAARGVVLYSTEGSIGTWIAPAGDVNGDGYADMLIGATGATGHLYLVMGRKNFSSRTVDIKTDAAAVLPLDSLGATAVGVGDMNGDGVGDFIVADPNNSYKGSGPALYLFSGSANFQKASSTHPQQSLKPLTDRAAIFTGPLPLGSSIAALGDVNGDKLADFAFTSAGLAHLVFGHQGGGWPLGYSGDRHLTNYPLAANGVVAAPGDVAGPNAAAPDGLNDIVLVRGDGVAYLITGSTNLPTLPVASATLTKVASVASTLFAAGADLNCDRSSDLLVLPTDAASGSLARTELSYGPVPHVREASLPVSTGSGGTQAAQSGTSKAMAAVDVHVSPTYCSACANDGYVWGTTAFSTIQSAINSGAQRVLVGPGVYREAVTLKTGVKLIGAGADTTVIGPPSTSLLLPAPQAVVLASGASNALLSRVTVDATGIQNGVLITSGAKGVQVTRSIVRKAAGRAIGVADAATQADIVNNTIIGGSTGVEVSCSTVTVRNTAFAYQTNSAIRYVTAGCPAGSAPSITYNLFWGNAADLVVDGVARDAATPGAVFADPLFTNPSQNDYRPLADSPLIGAGDPADPVPPGSGTRVDIGYVQQVQASFFADDNYCQTCINDGLTWGVDAFGKIQEAVGAANQFVVALGASGTSTPQGLVVTVGVGPGTYSERVSLPSHVRLVGSGAEQTIINGTTASPVRIKTATQVEVSGLQLVGGSSGAGVEVVYASSFVTVTRNIVRSNKSGIVFANSSSGLVLNNTVVSNTGPGVSSYDAGTWVEVRDNILANNAAGLYAVGGGQILNDYNLLNANTTNYQIGTGSTLVQGANDIVNRDPLFVNAVVGDYRLRTTSPAVDAADPLGDVPVGGGARMDIGYREVTAAPLALLLGTAGTSCAMAVSGIGKVDVGLSFVTDPTLPITATVPSVWLPATLKTASQAGSYWTASVTPASGNGLYRVYARAADRAGNMTEGAAGSEEGAMLTRATGSGGTVGGSWYRDAFVADGTPPDVQFMSPTDGSTTGDAALDLVAHVKDTVKVGDTTQSNLDAVEFEVDGAVVAADHVGGGIVYRASAPVGDGAHTLVAVARDKAGNETRVGPRTVTVLATKDTAIVSWPVDQSAVMTTTVPVQGYARFVGAAPHQVALYVDGAAVGPAQLADAQASFSAWSGTVTLTGEGTHRIAAAPGSDKPSGSQAIKVVLDLTPPAVAVAEPPEGNVITTTLMLKGTANDSGSGVAAVDVSLDGGYVWLPAALNSGAWELTVPMPSDSDYVTYSVLTRARDAAGNEAVTTRLIVVDNLGPTSFSPVTATPEQESYLQAPAEVKLEWVAPRDASGVVRTFVVVDTMTDTIPVTDGAPLGGTSYTAQMSQAGDYYVHLAAQDAIGNLTVRHYGPWFVGARLASMPGPRWQSSIQVDGRLDVAGGEWNVSTEMLDRDPRIAPAHELWASFDGSAMYLGSRGANRASVGGGYIYLDTVPGGTHNLWQPEGETPLPPRYQLPFDADTLVVADIGGLHLLRFDGASWQPVDAPDVTVALGGEGDTEMRLPWSVLQTSVGAADVRLLAFGVAPDGEHVTSVFPTTNSLLGLWSDAYHWAGISPSTVPNADQPRGHHVEMSVSSEPPTTSPVGPGQAIQYVVNVINRDQEAHGNAHLLLTTSDGLRLEGLQGYPTPPAGQLWRIELGTLANGSLAPITVTARLGADLSATGAVTLTALLATGTLISEPTLTAARLSHTVDARAPAAQIDIAADGATLQPGRQVVHGTASAGPSGVGKVEVRVGDGPWQTADGTSVWQAEVDIPSSAPITLAARATDTLGLVGSATIRTVTVDDVAPVATVTAPDNLIVRGVVGQMQGTAHDLFPVGGLINRVETQVDDNPWRVAEAVSAPGADGTVTWRQSWTLPSEEGVEHLVRVRAVDAAGNVGQASEAVKVTIDNVKPQSSIVSPQPGTTLPQQGQDVLPGEMLAWGYAVDGWAVSGVDVSVDGAQTWHRAELGQAAAELLARYGKAQEKVAEAELWAIVLPTPLGDVMVNSRAIDRAGNVEVMKAPVRVTQTHAAPIHLWLPFIFRRP